MLRKLIVSLLALFAIVPFTAGCSGGGAESTKVEGNWADEPTFTAIIQNNHIEITLVGDESKSLYWDGSFAGGTIDDGTSIVSDGNTEKLSRSLLGSTDDQKTFTYEDGTINFEFSIMGTTKTVHLEKQ